MLIDCWAVKLLFSWASAVWVFLFGDAGAILGVVVVEIILDTLTKWVAIIKRYLIDQGHKPEEITVTAMLLLCKYGDTVGDSHLKITSKAKETGF